MIKTTIFFSILIFSSFLYAGDFSYCAKIGSDRERLSCFDNIVKKLGIPIKKETEKIEEEKSNDLPKWVVSDSSSEMDDSKTVVMSLESENTVTGWLTKNYSPTLIIRCQENKTDMYMNTESQFHRSSLDSVKAKIRLDDEKSKTYRFSVSTDNMSIFFRKPIGHLKKMFSSQEMKIGWTPFNANPVIAKFDIRGLKDLIKPLRKTCNW